MTERQRDYLADLAGRKGVRLENTDNYTPAQASAKIKEIKEVRDASFNFITPEVDDVVDKKIEQINAEVSKWTFRE